VTGIGVVEERDSSDAESVGGRPGLGRSPLTERLLLSEDTIADVSRTAARGEHEHHPMPGLCSTSQGAGIE
jgi:hypothetical protein